MSKLLINEYPLMVLPTLATRVGLNEAIILQQIHYWLEINKQTERNKYDDKYWVYGSYDEWREQFPFWGRNTIVRAMNKLENLGLVVSGNYNKRPFDRTKWYTINYEALKNLENEQTTTEESKPSETPTKPVATHLPKMGRSIDPKWVEHLPKMGRSHLPKMGRPIPETTETNNRDINTYVQTAESGPVDNFTKDNGNDSRADGPPIVDSPESTYVSSSIDSSTKRQQADQGQPTTEQGKAAETGPSSVKKETADAADKPRRTARTTKTFDRMRRLARNDYPPEFEAFWKEYPRKEAKSDAFRAWQIGKEAFELDDEQMTRAAKAYAYDMQRQQTERRFIKLCGGWIREGRVLDYLNGDTAGDNDAATMYERYMRILNNIDDDTEGGSTS